MADTVMDRGSAINFSDPSSFHDRIFIVGGEKFYVFSGVLSYWSEYFRRMFEGNFLEAASKEIEINDVEAGLFKKYLHIIHDNSSELKGDDVIPMIHLSYRFLTPRVLDYCKKYLRGPSFLQNPLNLELLRVACLYNIKDLKRELVRYFMDEKTMSKFKVGEVVDVVIEFNLEDLKNWLGGYMGKNVTVENCIAMLESSVKFNMPTLKEEINKQIGTWDSWKTKIPIERVIELTMAAFEYDLQNLKDKLRRRIAQLCKKENVEYDSNGVRVKNFLREYYEDVKKLPENIKDFVILSVVD